MPWPLAQCSFIPQAQGRVPGPGRPRQEPHELPDCPSRQKKTPHLPIFISLRLWLWLKSHTVIRLLYRVWLLATPWTVARQAPLFFTISWNLLELTSIESVMPSNHLILLPTSPPAFNPFHNLTSDYINPTVHPGLTLTSQVDPEAPRGKSTVDSIQSPVPTHFARKRV